MRWTFLDSTPGTTIARTYHAIDSTGVTGTQCPMKQLGSRQVFLYSCGFDGAAESWVLSPFRQKGARPWAGQVTV